MNEELINNVVVGEDVSENGTAEILRQAIGEPKAETETKGETKVEVKAESKETDSQDKPPVSPETNNQAQEKSPVQVPISVVQEERQKRQELQRQLEEAQALLAQKEAASKQIQEQGPLDPNDPDPLVSIADDDWDIMLASEQRKVQREHEAWVRRETARQNQVAQQQYYQYLDTLARQEFTAEKMGLGMDYDSVVKTGSSWLNQQDQQAIRMSKEPQVELYKLCIARCPHLQKPAQAVKAEVTHPATQQAANPAIKVQVPPKEEEPIEYDNPLDELVAGVVLAG